MKDCFILGSGKSLLDLSKEEIEYVNRSDFVLAFNKYLIFYKKVGIVPTHYMLVDTHHPAEVVLYETLRVCKRDRLERIPLFINESWKETISSSIFSMILKRLLSNALLKKTRVYAVLCHRGGLLGLAGYMKLPLGMSVYLRRHKQQLLERTTFVRCSDWLKGGDWANSSDQVLFHYRGALTTAINIAHIFNPGSKIKLLGVDLDTNEYFFQQEFHKNAKKWQDWTAEVAKGKRHMITLPLKGTVGIQHCFPFILENVRKLNGDLVCCNPKSYLVEKGILEYEPVVRKA